MKTTIAALTVLAAAAAAFGAPEWEDPAVNEIDRMPAAVYAPPLASEKDALSDALEPPTPWTMSLDGKWRLRWAGNPARAEKLAKGFEQPGYDDSQWGSIDVPSCLDLKGYGQMYYVNIAYPHKKARPKIRDRASGRADHNPTACYRRTFKIPEAWAGRETILRFEGAGAAYYVWINGKFAGYAEDSRLASEFDITKLLDAKGENTIAVKLLRWSDGSYVEDQDMFRYYGIFRSVTLWSRPKAGIADFFAKTKLSADMKSAALDVEVKTYGEGGEATAALYDAAGKKVGEGLEISVPRVRLWSAEDPYLYTLVVKRGEDVRAKKIGFKEQRVEYRDIGGVKTGVVLVNGKPVKFKGVNRHECHPERGASVTLDDMVKDVELMKRHNINTVRTCHYPDHRLWYDLCDRYGIYVIAEADVEAHEYGYGKEGLGKDPAWEKTIVERNVRNVAMFRNNPCVTLWSLGNETGHGVCFEKAAEEVRKTDGSRPVHWERGNDVADVDSSMYPAVEWVEKRGKAGGKPYIMCEYAHAMGNAVGNLQEYWDAIYAHPALCGGCIWDWADQAVWKYTGRADARTGAPERFLAYGGDFDESPNNGPFCDNGLVDPMRNVSPKLLETAHVYRNLAVKRAKDGTLTLVNRHLFTPASAFDGAWSLLEDGAKIAGGAFSAPAVAPLSEGALALPGLDAALAKLSPGKEYFLNIEFATRKDEIWAKAPFVVAREQLAVPAPAAKEKPQTAEEKKDGGEKTPEDILASGRLPALVTDLGTGELLVQFGESTAIFDRRRGMLTRLAFHRSLNIIETPAAGVFGGPRLACARAFTDNDKRMVKPFFDSGLSQLRHFPLSTVVTNNTIVSVVDAAGSKGAGFTHECTYVFHDDGSLELRSKTTPYGETPELPRLGLTMLLPARFENMVWYGRGPHENYIDRNTSTFVGVWRSTVSEQFVDYVKPQDNGGKSDARWVEFLDSRGEGVRFSGSTPMFVQALHCDWEQLWHSRHRNGEFAHRTPIVPRRETVLNIDWRQTGLGGNSCGPWTMDKYRFDPKAPTEWTLKIEPVSKDARK